MVRGGDKPLVAVVQRRKDDGWVLPKGKLKRDESAIAGAEREVVEETGQDVIVHEFLGAISYMVGGKPKLVQFWRMEATDKPARKLTKDIKAVKWLSLESAIKKLDDPLEQLFLRSVAEHALAIAKPIAKPAEIAEPVAEPVRQPIADQPTALTLPIVEPSFVAEPKSRKEQEAPVPSESIPKPNVLPTPVRQPVVLTTSAPKRAVLLAPTPEAAPTAIAPRRIEDPPMVIKFSAQLPVVTKPAAEPSMVTRPGVAAVARLAPQTIAASPAPTLAARPSLPVATRPLAPAVATKPTGAPAIAAMPPVSTKPAPTAAVERNVAVPPAAPEPRTPANLFGRVLQRLQLDWTDQRRHWTAGTARRNGR